jgi:hypothetical protein
MVVTKGSLEHEARKWHTTKSYSTGLSEGSRRRRSSSSGDSSSRQCLQQQRAAKHATWARHLASPLRLAHPTVEGRQAHGMHMSACVSARLHTYLSTLLYGAQIQLTM